VVGVLVLKVGLCADGREEFTFSVAVLAEDDPLAWVEEPGVRAPTLADAAVGLGIRLGVVLGAFLVLDDEGFDV